MSPEIWPLAQAILDRLVVPKGSIWVGKNYDLAALRADIEEIMRLALIEEAKLC